MRRFLLTVAAVATTLAGTACGDSTGIGNVAGSYELRTINGLGLPVEDQFNSRTYLAGQLELEDDGTFTDIIQYRDFDNSLRTSQSFGTWERSGSEIRFDYNEGFTFRAERISNSRIVLIDENGDEWEYQRF